MWIMAWTENHGNNDMRDFWKVCETQDEARLSYNEQMLNEKLHCAAYGPITCGTEPHYTEA